jgi:hypothetical protein
MLSWLPEARSQSGMMVDAVINGKPARLELDTGSAKICLFQAAAKRLAIERSFQGARKVGVSTRLWESQAYATTLRWPGGSTSRLTTSFTVIEPPHNLAMTENADGLVGWGAISENIIEFDGARSEFKFLSKVPTETKNWTKATLFTKDPSAGLALELQAAVNSNMVVLVRTGTRGGVGLPWPNWREWKTSHPRQFSTINSYYEIEWGRVAREQMWASSFTLGPLSLTDLVLEEGARILWGTNSLNVSFLSRGALARLDLIVDGPRRMAYLRPQKNRGIPGEHNRLGAVFLPRDTKSSTLVAIVANPSPAFAAGIRDGDVLLRFDELDATRWWVGEGFSLDDRLNGPAGNKVKLKLEREGQPFEALVVLEDILGPTTKNE